MKNPFVHQTNRVMLFYLTAVLSACGGRAVGGKAAATYAVGGTIAGLGEATGLVLQLNGAFDLTIAASATTFTFSTADLADEAAYTVTVCPICSEVDHAFALELTTANRMRSTLRSVSDAGAEFFETGPTT